MKIINPDVKYIPQLEFIPKYDMFKHIERCAKTCYKSEDKITTNSAEAFVKRLIESKHYAMLEHGTVYLYFEVNPNNATSEFNYPSGKFTSYYNWSDVVGRICSKYSENPYSVVNYCYCEGTRKYYITTNYRVIVENDWLDDMQFISKCKEFHTPRITLKFITNIGVTREGNRMRANSIAEESTRYCNYNKDKFDKQITYCKPSWINERDIKIYQDECIRGLFNYDEAPEEFKAIYFYYNCIANCQTTYNALIDLGWKPQQAREVLPLATKSEVVYTAYPSDWKHFFDLRLFATTGAPHPNMKEVAQKAKDVLINEGLWNLIYPDNETV